jgi:hypothetical protein
MHKDRRHANATGQQQRRPCGRQSQSEVVERAADPQRLTGSGTVAQLHRTTAPSTLALHRDAVVRAVVRCAAERVMADAPADLQLQVCTGLELRQRRASRQ